MRAIEIERILELREQGLLISACVSGVKGCLVTEYFAEERVES
jgi:hypothetical protein